MKYVHQDIQPEGWGQLHQFIGNAHYFRGCVELKPFSYWYKAVNSYNQAQWVNANVLLRFVTREPDELFQRASRLVEQAEQGEATLRLSPLVVAEIVWVLGSFYRYSHSQIAEVLVPLVTAQGIALQEADLVVTALNSMASANVDFIDAFLAETARREGRTVASFERDFCRLGVAWVKPE